MLLEGQTYQTEDDYRFGVCIITNECKKNYNVDWKVWNGMCDF